MLSSRTAIDRHSLHLGTAKRGNEKGGRPAEQVRIPDPSSALHAYPHQFSGGMAAHWMRSRSRGPRLLIADEPTTALDVTVQAGF
jgi:ABC-type dipeptide/oligopeptide/nickel transport system ATPase component